MIFSMLSHAYATNTKWEKLSLRKTENQGMEPSNFLTHHFSVSISQHTAYHWRVAGIKSDSKFLRADVVLSECSAYQKNFLY